MAAMVAGSGATPVSSVCHKETACSADRVPASRDEGEKTAVPHQLSDNPETRIHRFLRTNELSQ